MGDGRQGHAAAHAVKTRKRGRVHLLAQASPPLWREFWLSFHTAEHDEMIALQKKVLAQVLPCTRLVMLVCPILPAFLAGSSGL